MKKIIHKLKFVILFSALIVCNNLFSQTSTGCWKSFSGGDLFTLGITTDGKLWSWGFNNFAQLGIGTQGNTANPNKSQIGIENQWNEVEAGFEYGLAIKNDGTLWAWGANSFGMLGDGTTITRKSPVQIGTDTNWSKISAGTVNTLAIKNDGTLWAWGRNNSGQLGDGTIINKLVPTQIGVDSDWKEISVGQLHCIALKSNGTLWAWGENGNGQLGLADNLLSDKNIPTQVGTATNWDKISAGRNFNLAIKNDGTLWSWGQNDFGQLGNGFSTGNVNDIPTQRGTDIDWANIAAGAIHSIALKTNGTRWAWGSNGSGSLSSGSIGALGDNTIINKNIPTQIGTDTDWQKPNAGIYFSLCLKNDGSLWSNGRNNAGELGDNTQTASRIPILVTCPITLSSKVYEVPYLTVYPNPSSGLLYVKGVPESAILSKVEVKNNLGQTLISNTNFEPNQALNLNNYANGMYFIQITSENKTATFKVLKQ
jgi:alpha-tubulin suppressor-like RCC1 family protein